MTPLNICILARKRLYRNTRIFRQAKTLSSAGHKVTVLAIELPSPEFLQQTPDVEYIKVSLEPLPAKVIRFISKINRLIDKRSYRIIAHKLSITRSAILKRARVIFKTNIEVKLQPNSSRKNSFIGQQQRNNKDLTFYLRVFLRPYFNSARTIDFANKAFNLLNGQNIDYCQAHDTFALLAAKKIAKTTGAEILYDAVEIPDDRSGNTSKNTPGWVRFLENRRDEKIIRSSRKIMAIGDALAEWTAKRYNVPRPCVIRNCCMYTNREFDKRMRNDLNIDNNEKIALAIGSIYAGQGAEQLMDCLPYLNRSVHIVLLGPLTQKDYFSMLTNQIMEKNIHDRFHVLPPQPPHDLISYASGADLGVIALQNTSMNHYYSLPNRLFEMIMARLPIACGRLPNIQSVVEKHGVGAVFNETDPCDIAHVINTMLQPVTHERLKVNVDKTAKVLCWEKEAERYVALFENGQLSENLNFDIVILARKRLVNNTRIVRQAKVLSEIGHNVTVISIELPSDELIKQTSKVQYLRVDLDPLPARLLSFVSRSKRSLKRILRGIGRRYLLRVKRLPFSLIRWTKVFFHRMLIKMNIFRHKSSIPIKLDPLSLGKYLMYLLVIRPMLVIMSILVLPRDTRNRTLEILIKNTGDYKSLIRTILVPFLNTANTIQFANKAVYILKDQKFDFCQAHDTFALSAAAKVAKATGAKIIYDAVEIPDDRSGTALNVRPYWLQQLENIRDIQVIRSSFKVLAIGPSLSRWTAKRYSIPQPCIIRNCTLYACTDDDIEIKQDLKIDASEKVAIIIGNIYRGQGIENLIDSTQYLNSGIHIVLLGVESQRGYLQRLYKEIQKIGASECFHILPPKPPSSLLSYASGADIGVIARQNTCLNNYYSLPNKVFEMIMARLPIACGRLPDIKSLVEHYKIGMTFDETDPKDIASVINVMMQPDIHRSLKSAVYQAAKELCWEEEGKRYLRIFAEANSS